jgi:peptidoglycan/LPS O-acetylase OafA/YrhL
VTAPVLTPRPSTPYAPPARPTEHVIPELYGLRGVAVLLTLAQHWQDAFPTGTTLDGLVRRTAEVGWLGVELFFGLSGFLITGILLASRQREPSLRRYLGRFMWRRALRIFPLYYVTLVALLFVLPALVPIRDPAFATLHHYQAWYWLYGVNWLQAVHGGGVVGFETAHFWSLSVEEQFYLAWPLLVWWAGPRRVPWVCGVLWVGSMVGRWLVPVDVDPWRWTTPLHLDALMAGALLAWTATTPWWLRVTAILRRASLPAVLVVLGTAWFHVGAWTSAWPWAVRAVGIGCLLAATLTADPTSRWRVFCRSGVMQRFGTYSYCIYLLHYPLMGLLNRALPKLPIAQPFGSHLLYAAVYLVLLVSITYSVGAVSWRYFEAPILRLKDRWP